MIMLLSEKNVALQTCILLIYKELILQKPLTPALYPTELKAADFPAFKAPYPL